MLVASGAELALQAADAARPPVPIVMLANNFDPIARGYVKSLSHPGGNITGLVYRQPELAAKQLELLAEAFPGRTRVGLLWDQYSVDGLKSAERMAQSLRLTLRPLKLENPPYDWDTAFRNLSEREAEMLLVLSSPLFTPHRARIAELAVRHRLPSMYIFRYYVTAGGLISYGVNTGPLWRRAASYVAKILRGAQPADLPVEQTSNFELAINLKTAKALGVEIPTVDPAARRRGDRIDCAHAVLLRCLSPVLCRFSDAGNDDLTTRSGDRRPKSAKARNRVGG